ncbi:DedA family protein [Nocardiopsis sp. NRRL B-16309]|uniref:DedA family protein n=1 Tax=Nocardiopsis sp. NRRL B-16309 TaxID=1519494 RepID=UPI0006C08045|nr:VTT domain-containing protein [Nocardiopsis sp. NRRL B-16309]KOX11301.1 membrane-associated protein [Nocardiopsis sp. NRRL B-16309]
MTTQPHGASRDTADTDGPPPASADAPATLPEAADTSAAATDSGGPLSPEEERRREKERKEEEAMAALRAIKPWEGAATRQDKALLAAFIVIPAVFLALTPLKPLLIADHPVGLAMLTGSNAAIGAASAFASIGEIPLWLVLCAGVFGKIKVDWLFWWLGRRWGRGIVNLLTPSERARRLADRVRDANPWWIRGAVLISYVPGVPAALVLVVAGWTGMRLRTFMVLDACGALLMTGVVAAAGYAAGQAGVDIILTVDRYALWITLAIIFAMAFAPVIRQSIRTKAAERARAQEAAGTTDAESAESEEDAASPAGPAAAADESVPKDAKDATARTEGTKAAAETAS